ncbi:MAG: segregation/condensation protein A [Nanoarchaeota archaeon]
MSVLQLVYYPRRVYKYVYIEKSMFSEIVSKGDKVKQISKVSQEQVHDLLFGQELSWHAIIYDLINTEQLDPWDMDLAFLADKYLEMVKNLEEANYFVSSKVLLAAALLLRIKSEILLEKHIRSVDEILFGKKEEKKYEMERIELDEEIPGLMPKSPLPRSRKISLQELMTALNKAISTENRRIHKEILNKNALRESSISFPKRTINIKDKIKEVYERILGFLQEEKIHRVAYSDISGKSREEKINAFLPVLHLDHQGKIWMEQEKHFEEIYLWMQDNYLKHNNIYDRLIKEMEETEIKYRKKKNEKGEIVEIADDEDRWERAEDVILEGAGKEKNIINDRNS